jgi:transposase
MTACPPTCAVRGRNLQRQLYVDCGRSTGDDRRGGVRPILKFKLTHYLLRVVSEFELRVLGRKRKDTEGPSRTATTRRSPSSPVSRLRGLAAPKVYDRPMNAALFEEWVENMDNLPAHKGARIEQLINSAGAELRYLPPYSPDMNPIEKAFSKLKATLRKLAGRTVAGLTRALDACADIVKPDECTNYFAACGYDTT